MTLPMLAATIRGAARAIDKKGALNYSSSYALQLALTNAYEPAIRELLPMPDSNTNLSNWMLKCERQWVFVKARALATKLRPARAISFSSRRGYFDTRDVVDLTGDTPTPASTRGSIAYAGKDSRSLTELPASNPRPKISFSTTRDGPAKFAEAFP